MGLRRVISSVRQHSETIGLKKNLKILKPTRASFHFILNYTILGKSCHYLILIKIVNKENQKFYKRRVSFNGCN